MADLSKIKLLHTRLVFNSKLPLERLTELTEQVAKDFPEATGVGFERSAAHDDLVMVLVETPTDTFHVTYRVTNIAFERVFHH